jgi:MinD-like ATPase involved in chromosome partitioning or flagellar assembly
VTARYQSGSALPTVMPDPGRSPVRRQPRGAGPAGGKADVPRRRVPTDASGLAALFDSRPVPQPASRGWRRFVRAVSAGLVAPEPGRAERAERALIADIRRPLPGLRQITVANPKGGSGKTTAVIMLGLVIGQARGGNVLAWDVTETQGTLGMRTAPGWHRRTRSDLQADLCRYTGRNRLRVGDLAMYARDQGEAMFRVLVAPEDPAARTSMDGETFAAMREVIRDATEILVVDTGNDVSSDTWRAVLDRTDLLVVTTALAEDSARSASRMLDILQQHGHGGLVANAVTVVSHPASAASVDAAAIRAHFAARTHAVMRVPHEPLLYGGKRVPYRQLPASTRRAWTTAAAAVVAGL